jgi:UDP-glucose 4-epimerase
MIIVTGGSGFIGQHLINKLKKSGHLVGNFDCRPRPDDAADQFFNGDIRNTLEIEKALKGASYVFHLAAVVGVAKIYEDPITSMQINIQGTENILNVCSKLDLPVFVASSSEVYGVGTKIPFSEKDDVRFSSTQNLRWNYAYSKAIDEMYALALDRRNELRPVIGRFFNTVGPNQSGQYGMVIPNFVRNALKGDDLIVHGDGTQTRCFTHVSDTVEILYNIMQSHNSMPKIINIGNDEEISILSVAEKAIEICQSSSNITFRSYGEVFDKDFKDLLRRVPDLTLLHQTLGRPNHKSISRILHDVRDAMCE